MGKGVVSLSFGWVFSKCGNRAALISSAMEEALRGMVARSGFTVFTSSFYKFPEIDGEESGYTAAVIIGESLVDIHTWPEEDCAHVRIFYCDFSQDNTAKKDELYRLFKETFEPGLITGMEMQKYPIC